MAVKSRAIKDYGRIGVLMGGPSSEREVSLKSGKAVYESLKELSLDAVAIDITTEDRNENISLIGSYNIDCAFLALHGRFGEDGKIQEILDFMNMPYTASGKDASRLSMDKVASRQVLSLHNVTVPSYTVLDKASYNPGHNKDLGLKYPLVVKPSSHGSSIGLSIIDSEEALAQAVELAFGFDDRVILEEYISGKEITVGILDDKPLPVIEIIPKSRFFDFEAKYHSGMTEYVVPARLEEKILKSAQSTALEVHNLLGCYGCSRVDLILGENGAIYVLELNSIPGFTPTSLLPKAAKVAGVEFPELCLKLIELAYEKAEKKITA